MKVWISPGFSREPVFIFSSQFSFHASQTMNEEMPNKIHPKMGDVVIKMSDSSSFEYAKSELT